MTCHRAASRTASLLFLVALQAQAQGFTVAPGGSVPLPLESSALIDEATALSMSPGGLAFVKGLQFEYVRAEAFANRADSGDGFYLAGGLGPLVLGLSTEWFGYQPCLGDGCRETRTRRTSYGLGLRLSSLGAGVVRHSYSAEQGTPLDGFATWDVGVTWRPWRALSLSLAMLDVDTPVLRGSHVIRRLVGGVGLRPFGEKLTLGADFSQVTECGHTDTGGPSIESPAGCDRLGWRFTADALVTRGVHLLGQVAREPVLDHWSGQVGLAVDLGHLGLLYAQAVNPSGGPQGYLRVRLSTDAWPSPSSDHAALVKLDEALKPASRGLVSLLLGGSRLDPHAETLAALGRLARDGSVRTVVLSTSGIPGGLGKAEELRKGIGELRSAGKKVLFFLENGGDLEYYVASAADRILAAPQAVLAINGFSATALFAAEGLHKLGVKAEFVRVGAYKNAPDLFTRQDMSAEQREVQNALLDDTFGRFVHEVAGRRGIGEDKLKALLDRGILRPQEAVEGGLLDGLVYPDQIEEEAGKLYGSKVPLREVAVPGGQKHELRWGSRPRIALIRVEGNIAGGESHGDPLGAVTTVGSESVARQIRSAAADGRVKAIVVRIDSPGGDGNASDLIWRELRRARKEKGKPVIASMGDVAASGGYYVAAGCDEIFAEPSTVTGSIGVFFPKFDASELFQKLGIHLETVKRGQSADLFGTNRSLTASEKETMQQWVDSFYEQFVGRVAEARKLPRDEVDKVARGRVWTGKQALERKLVDRLGGLQEALAYAAEQAGLHAGDEVEVDDQGRAATLEVSDLAAAALGSEVPLAAIGGLPRREAVRALRALSLLGEPGTLRAVLPYVIEVR